MPSETPLPRRPVFRVSIGAGARRLEIAGSQPPSGPIEIDAAMRDGAKMRSMADEQPPLIRQTLRQERDRDVSQEIARIVDAIRGYVDRGHLTGGALHGVIEDGNVEDEHILASRTAAIDCSCGHTICEDTIALCDALMRLTLADRERAIRTASPDNWGYPPQYF